MIYHTLSKSGDSGEKRLWNLLHILPKTQKALAELLPSAPLLSMARV